MTTELKAALMADGYADEIAEALAENDISVEHARLLSKEEVMDKFLTYNGIIGFTGMILRAINNCEENCNF